MDKREAEAVEFKRSTTYLREGIISLCSMLNRNKKGIVIFGVREDGEICGQEVGKQTLSDISQEIELNLKPIPEVSINVESFDGKDVIRVGVSGSDTPYQAYGRYYDKVDDSYTVMDPVSLWKFFDSKRKTYSRWEKQPTYFDEEYVNEELLLQYIHDANDRGRLNYVFSNANDALSKLNLISSDGLLNNAGYFLFGKNGPVLLKEVTYPTDERRSFSDMKQFKGNILECIDEGLKYIKDSIHYKEQVIDSRRLVIPEIPIEAIREILINSFVHCHYHEGDCIEISITSSKIRIYNPGGILDNINPLDFSSGKTGCKIRNPLIASVLYKNGMVEARGLGFDRAFKLCADNNIEYEYNNDENGFTFIFKRSLSVINKEQKFVNTRANPVDRKLIKLLTDNPYASLAELAKKTDRSVATIHRHLSKLVLDGKIERKGSRKTGCWQVTALSRQ